MCQALGWQQSIHRAGTETFQIQSDVSKTKSLENTSERRGHFCSHGTGQLVTGNFQANDISMMTNPELAKSKRPQRVFALLDDQ